MGMKPPQNEPQPALCHNLVSNPKDTGPTLPEQNLVSSAKVPDESVKGMPGNVLVGGSPSTTEKPG